jgi:hypothetical protein
LERKYKDLYFIYWQNKLLEYHTYCTKTSDEFSDMQKLRMLQNAVHPVPELRQIRINEDILITDGKQGFSYDQYSQLLLSAADAHNDNIGRRNFIPTEAWLRIPEVVRKLLYNCDNDNNSNNMNRVIQKLNGINLGESEYTNDPTYLGVPIKGKSHLFGDNTSVVTRASIPHSSLKKRHNALSFHRVHEAITAGI